MTPELTSYFKRVELHAVLIKQTQRSSCRMTQVRSLDHPRCSMTQASKQRGNSEKRRRILDGALRAFAKKGFYNTKVSEIASEAGVADGTIYLYFKNKDDLLISLFEDRMEWIIERLEGELATTEGSVVEKVHKFIRLHFLLVLENRELAEFLTVELRQSAKFVKE